MKKLVQDRYRGAVHYVWCSESFDSAKEAAYSIASLVPPSSNPANIYRDIRAAVDKGDLHCAKIVEQRASLKVLANKWHDAKEVTLQHRDEIIAMSDSLHAPYWRPLIYVIPRAPVESRLVAVEVPRRASIAPEFIIPDLRAEEVDFIEL